MYVNICSDRNAAAACTACQTSIISIKVKVCTLDSRMYLFIYVGYTITHHPRAILFEITHVLAMWCWWGRRRFVYDVCPVLQCCLVFSQSASQSYPWVVSAHFNYICEQFLQQTANNELNSVFQWKRWTLTESVWGVKDIKNSCSRVPSIRTF